MQQKFIFYMHIIIITLIRNKINAKFIIQMIST